MWSSRGRQLGAGVTYGNLLWFPLMQQEVPAGLLGRASAVDWMLSLALAPAGIVAGGALAALAGVRLALVLGGSVAAAAGAVLLVPGVTGPDRPAAGVTRSERLGPG